MSGDSCTYSGLQLFKHCYTFNYLLCSYSNSFLIIFNIILCRFFFFFLFCPQVTCSPGLLPDLTFSIFCYSPFMFQCSYNGQNSETRY